MVTVQPWGMLSKVKSLVLRKLPMLKLKPTPRWRMSKLPWGLRKLRCEGVELCVIECKFCKDILARLRHRTFHEMEWFFPWITFMILMFVLWHLFTWIIWFSLKAEARWPVVGEIVLINAEASPPGQTPLSKERRGGGASQKKQLSARSALG
jgi:hypothetical protein